MTSLLISLRGTFSSSFASAWRSSLESSLLASMGSPSIEASSFSPDGALPDGPITSVGASSEEDSIAGEAGRDGNHLLQVLVCLAHLVAYGG